jgi:hypothetical protein
MAQALPDRKPSLVRTRASPKPLCTGRVPATIKAAALSESTALIHDAAFPVLLLGVASRQTSLPSDTPVAA